MKYKLLVSEIAPFLAYDVNAYFLIGSEKVKAVVEGLLPINEDWYVVVKYLEKPYNIKFDSIELILNPISKYSEILEITDEMTEYEISMIEDNPDMVTRLSYDVIDKMLKNHIDVFGLIGKKLATNK